MKTILALSLLLAIAGCNQPTQTEQEGEGNQAPQAAPVDKDPTPQTGTGGDAQGTTPAQ